MFSSKLAPIRPNKVYKNWPTKFLDFLTSTTPGAPTMTNTPTPTQVSIDARTLQTILLLAETQLRHYRDAEVALTHQEQAITTTKQLLAPCYDDTTPHHKPGVSTMSNTAHNPQPHQRHRVELNLVLDYNVSPHKTLDQTLEDALDQLRWFIVYHTDIRAFQFNTPTAQPVELPIRERDSVPE